MTEIQLFKELQRIRPINQEALEAARMRWSQIAKPLNSLGLLEEAVSTMAGIFETPQVYLQKKALVIMCADNGVVEEGVTQTGQEVTSVVARNITWGKSCACLMANNASVQVFPVDVGIAGDLTDLGAVSPMTIQKISYGTKNFTREPAMTRQEACDTIEVGIEMVKKLKGLGYQLIATGEMGIGNTTTSSAVASVLLGVKPETITGKGAGLSQEGLARKIGAIERGLALHAPDREHPIDLLAKVGGFDLAALTGLYLGGAIYRIPIVIDGFISSVAALLSKEIHPLTTDFMMASHCSAEPAGKMILEKLGKIPVIHASMCLGEGTGAVAAVSLFQMAADIYEKMSTFRQIEIEAYHPL